MFELEVTVQNVVLTGGFSEGVDLKTVHSALEGSRCSWRRFPGLIFKLKSYSATFLVFSSGKFVCTGTQSEEKGRKAIACFLQLLQTKSLVSANCTFECGVKNVVASIVINGASISLNRFTAQFKPSVYEPDRFPAAIYHLPQSKATLLVFSSGKLICSGVGDKETLNDVAKKFRDQLLKNDVLEPTRNT